MKSSCCKYFEARISIFYLQLFVIKYNAKIRKDDDGNDSYGNFAKLNSKIYKLN